MHKLTQFRLCPHSRSIRLALRETAVDVEMVEEFPWEWRPAFLALNPAGELPVLEMSDGAMLCGAYSISEYLAEADDAKSPASNADTGSGGSTGSGSDSEGPNDTDVGSGGDTGGRAAGAVILFPGDREERAEARRLVDWFHGKMDRDVTREMMIQKVHNRHIDGAPQAPSPETMRALRANLGYHLSYVAFLAGQRRWLAGEEMSFADLAAAGHFSVLDYLGEVPWEQYPDAKIWYQRVKSRKSFRPLLADRLPGMPPPPDYTDLDF